MVAKLKQIVQYMLRADLRATHACTVCGCLVAIEDQERHRTYHNKENQS